MEQQKEQQTKEKEQQWSIALKHLGILFQKHYFPGFTEEPKVKLYFPGLSRGNITSKRRLNKHRLNIQSDLSAETGVKSFCRRSL